MTRWLTKKAGLLGAGLGVLAATLPVGPRPAAPAMAGEGGVDLTTIFRCEPDTGVDKAACDHARELIVFNCTVCHLFVRIVDKRGTPEDWQATINRHYDRLPNLSREDFADITAYLAANFRPDLPPPEVPQAIRDQIDNPL